VTRSRVTWRLKGDCERILGGASTATDDDEAVAEGDIGGFGAEDHPAAECLGRSAPSTHAMAGGYCVATTSSADRGDGCGLQARGGAAVDMKLEVVVVPVSDVDRAKRFYQSLGWRLDADVAGERGFRVVQLTPPGSSCSLIFGTGVTSAAPGSAEGMQLVATDIEAARAEVAACGVDVSDVFHDAGGVFHHAGTVGRASGPAPEHKSYGSFASFSDPDGNSWFIQEVTTRRPGR
jgi:catechol 2,3-dioxygenase-like lactoylglutathione lyase family enzyme